MLQFALYPKNTFYFKFYYFESIRRYTLKTQEKLSMFHPTQHSDSFADNLARIALDIGEGLLKSGAEIHRVEDAIDHICKAYGAAHIEVFSIQSLIVVAVRMPDGSYASQSRRITNISNHLCCLEYYNRLSRDICRDTPDFDEVDKRIFEVKKKRNYRFIFSIIGHACAAGAFAVFFGGSLRDGLAGALIGIVMSLLDRIEAKFFTSVTKTLLIAFTAGMLSYLSVAVHIGEHTGMIAIGTIMILIPGLSLGNSMRDLLTGDTLAGILRAVQSCIIAVIIAIGYSISILLLESQFPTVSPPVLDQWQIWLFQGASSLIGTIGFALIFKISLKKLPTVAIGGLMTYIVYAAAIYIAPGNELFANFMAALFMAIFSEICARTMHAPAVVFLFPCAIPIVPGGALYRSMYGLLTGNDVAFMKNLSITGQVILGIALGLSVATLLWGTFSLVTHRIFKKKPRL